MRRIGLLWLLGLLLLASNGFAQDSEVKDEPKKLVQFSGVVVDGDSLVPIAFTSVIIKNSHRGTICDYYGFFSLVAEEGDTIRFSHVGYKPIEYIIPDTLAASRYSLIQILTRDTILLPETVVYPWPSREQFREAFLTWEIPDDDFERAKRNLERAELRERMEEIPIDGSTTFKYAMQQHQSRLYYAGQAPPNNLFNPLAWAKFIEAWKNGEFKRQKDP